MPQVNALYDLGHVIKGADAYFFTPKIYPINMHRFALIIPLLFFGIYASAQLQEGSSLISLNLGGNIKFKDKISPENFKSPFDISLGLGYGRLVRRTLEAGTMIGASHSRRSYLTVVPAVSGPSLVVTTNEEQTSYSGEVFVRKYKSIGNQLFIGSEGLVRYVFLQSTIAVGEDDPFTVPTHRFVLGYSPSLTYMIHPKIGVRGTFGFAGVYFSKNSTVEVWSTSLSLDFSPSNLNLGIFLCLNGTKSNN